MDHKAIKLFLLMWSGSKVKNMTTTNLHVIYICVQVTEIYRSCKKKVDFRANELHTVHNNFY